ncbi:hypothetical protein SELMODRAFT_441621 [Selaginella moellendorffii]|uniref:Uncharacterized protein n=1 Tax=Selaginella moellendorffii TaxID=88036 RepID=D8RL35_SELML|nr:exosome complex component RRP41-like [Selaginella moellendorffii]EFJ27555.1 hypothetical protein SELMODRAFT_441621 [Selaginella moellendorffii]|eukprot:XP_002971806.1 exosome complex component RRP41-like [Selaginella moellendorffii]
MARQQRSTQALEEEPHRAPVFSSDGERIDGRHAQMCRAAFLRTGAVRAAAGSAYAESGDTKVIVSVFGPRESKKAEAFSDAGRLNCNVKYCSFATPVRGKMGAANAEERDLSSMLYKSVVGAVDLRTFPKTTVDVFALVLQSGGGDLPVIVTCASLALADAGIVLYDLVAAVSASSIQGQVLLDPSTSEENCEDGSLMVAYMPSRKEITQVTMTGEWSSSRASESLELCLDACAKIGDVMRSCLKEAAAQ